MTDLLGAASRIDDAARALDRMFAPSGAGSGRATDLRIPVVMSDATTQLAAAMPNGLGRELVSFHVPYDAGIGELSKVRSQLAHLGAVTRAVHELGGVDHVVSQGGLDAIDGAADVIRRHLLLDAADQLRTVGSIIDERPFGAGMSRKARSQHLTDIRRAITAPMTQLDDAGLVKETGDTLVSRLSAAAHDAPRDQYERLLRDSRAMVDQVANANPSTLPGPSEAWSERMLVSNRARAIATETSARGNLPVAPRLATLVDDAAVLANAHAALDQHAATFEALQVAVGNASTYDAAFKDAFYAARPRLERAAEDVTRLKQLVVDAPDDMRNTGYLAENWVSYNARFSNRHSTERIYGETGMISNALEHIRSMQSQLTQAIDEPDLLRAGTEVADELKEVLARPGDRIDLAVVRSLLDGESSIRARSAFIDHLPTIKPHPVDAPRTSDVQEALQLLDEADVLGVSLRDQAAKGRWVLEVRLLSEPGLRAATTELLARADASLGTGTLVSEATSHQLINSVASIRTKLTDTSGKSYNQAGAYDVDGILSSIRAYRTELATRAERAAADGGLRAIPPSARPAQALEARSRWMLRELDSLAAPAADATSAERIEDAARRATVVHDLLRVANANPAGPTRTALVERAMTEYQSLGETWRMPDDVALDVWRNREEIQRTGTLDLDLQLSTARPGYNTNPGMNRAQNISAGLQSWSMFADGPLPETAADRLSVAARRGASVRTYLNSMVAAKGEKLQGLHFDEQVEELRRRVAFVEDSANGAVPGEVRNRLDELYSSIGSEVERRAAKQAIYEKPGDTPPATWAGRARLDEWIAALDDAHRTARAASTEQLAW